MAVTIEGAKHTRVKDLYDLGDHPGVGIVPKFMHAQVIRESRLGEPEIALQREVMPVPEIGPRELLVYVMSSGLNYNNIWAARGVPVNIIEEGLRHGAMEDFHIPGSDGSGIVWKTGSMVTKFKVGDEVVMSTYTWDDEDPKILAGQEPILSDTARVWGYQLHYGSLAQYTRVREHQCYLKPPHLTWEESSVYMLSGATAYRMLYGFPGNVVNKGNPVLIWGGSGGLGSMAIQLTKLAGGEPIAVISNDDKKDYCIGLGAVGTINRNIYDHWGRTPLWEEKDEYARWLEGVKSFGRGVWNALGRKENPAIVIEHPGESTLPTSLYIVSTGGMVAICAGTTGYNATFDLRYHWMRQKRLQGTNFATSGECAIVNQMIIDKRIDPCLTKVYTFEEAPFCHQQMHENRHSPGKTAIAVNSRNGSASC